jgi:hypothetical protein
MVSFADDGAQHMDMAIYSTEQIALEERSWLLWKEAVLKLEQLQSREAVNPTWRQCRW